MTHAATHRSIRFDHRAPAPPEAIFPLLCPVRERDWIPGWQADVLHSESGVAELGCVFVAGVHPMPDRAVFLVSRYEPPRAIELVVLRDDLVEHLQIALEPGRELDGDRLAAQLHRSRRPGKRVDRIGCAGSGAGADARTVARIAPRRGRWSADQGCQQRP